MLTRERVEVLLLITLWSVLPMWGALINGDLGWLALHRPLPKCMVIMGNRILVGNMAKRLV